MMATNTEAQDAIIELNSNSVTVDKLIREIEKQTDYLVVYSNREVNTSRTVNLKNQSDKVSEYLNQTFQGTDIGYDFEKNYIVLSKIANRSSDLSKKLIEVTQQQKNNITGTVVDASGIPIIGANIIEEGTTNGTITDNDGNFSLEVNENAVLHISYIGYIDQNINTKGKTRFNIKLIEDTQALDELIVVGYGTQKKSDVTGSIVTIKSDQIKNTSAVNAARALQGKAAGVDIVAAGQKPGDGSTIRIRGTRSFSASNDPLYVIDGIPFNRGINDLNPSDIESIEVLKDASATAIYGSRGANGVILITTKKAKEGKSEIAYDMFYGIQSAQKVYDMMDGAEYLELLREAGRASNLYPQDGSVNLADDLKLMKYRDQWTDESVQMGYDDSGIYNPSRVRSFDWGAAALQTGNILSHQISFTGGNDKAKVFISAGYYNETGIIKTQDFERFSFRINAEYDIKSWIKVGGSMAFTPSTRNNGSNLYLQATGINPLAIPFDEEGNIIDQPTKDSYVWNIYHDFDNKNYVSEEQKYRFTGSYYLDLNFGHGLKYRMNFGPDFGSTRDGVFGGVKSNKGRGGLSSANMSSQQYMTYVLENVLYYDNTFGKNHIGATLMQSVEQERLENLSGNVIDLPYEHQQFYNLGSASTITGVGSNLVEWKMLSYMARLNYSYYEKYLLTLTGRIDGSSRLSKGNKYTFFPSAALGWRLSEEDVFKDISNVDNLKLRMGYGETGNSSVSPYGTLGSLERTVYATDDDPLYGYQPNLLFNPNLGWEKTKQFNVGIDFSFFKGRVSGVIDGYRQRTTDLLLSRQLPTASGFSSITENVGSTQNTGLEIALSTVNVKTKGGFSWTSDFMFYTNKEEIISLYKGKVDDIGNTWFIGHPIVTHYDYKFDGIWQNTPEDLEKMQLINANGGTFKTGEIKIADIEGDNKITSEDRMILGNTVPKWTGSMTNTFNYKGFDLNIFFYARIGQMIKSSTNRLTLDTRTNSLDVNYWTPSNPSNEYPQPNRNTQTPNYIGTLTYEDGSFIKLRNLTFGYQIPSVIVQKIKASGCRLYINIENPLVLTKFTGLDPENGSSRGGEVTTPSTKRVLFGLNFTF